MNYLKTEKPLKIEKDNQIKTFLIFNLESEEYAIDILKIQEIHHYENVFSIHNAPVYLKGFMRLRDNVIPVIDLRILYNLKNVQYTEFTVVIILNIKENLLGIVVDETPEVINIKESQIKPIAENYAKIPNLYIKSIGIVEKRSILILDIEKLFTGCDLNCLGEALMNPIKT